MSCTPAGFSTFSWGWRCLCKARPNVELALRETGFWQKGVWAFTVLSRPSGEREASRDSSASGLDVMATVRSRIGCRGFPGPRGQ